MQGHTKVNKTSVFYVFFEEFALVYEQKKQVINKIG
jgi:hypothetical protein